MLWMLAAILTTSGAMAQVADDETVTPYFTSKEMPDMRHFLPAPPDTIGALFTHDIMQYMWGKTQRLDPVRCDIAKRDAVYGLDCIIQEFSEPFGLQISKEETPEIYRVLRDGTATCDSICKEPKSFYMRRRPFDRFNEHTLTPEDEPALLVNGSYPSGHTILGWSSALLLTEINPDRADTIMARGYMYGESRVIVGAHWQSDVDAGRLVASVAYAKLHTSEAFLQQMAKARAEFLEKTGQTTGVRLQAAQQPTTATAGGTYTLNGTPATESQRGIVIRDGQKMLVNK